MLGAFAAAFRTPDLRKKLLFTLGIIALFRAGSVVPTPGVSYTAIQKCLTQVQDNSVYGLINLFSGGALLQLSVFALGIMPYITSSIIIQLLTVVIPRLETLKKEGQSGTAKITQYTRYLTIGLAILQSTTIITLARTPGRLFSGCNEQLVPNQTIQVLLTMVVVMTAGTAMIMWLGELITDRAPDWSSLLRRNFHLLANQSKHVWCYPSHLRFIIALLARLGCSAFGISGWLGAVDSYLLRSRSSGLPSC